MDYGFLRGSDGTGPAVLAHIEATRLPGSTVINVDSLDNWSEKFIVTTGTLLPSGFLDPSTVTEMRAHSLAGDIIIDGFEPGFTDTGNSIGQVAMIKQTAQWANDMVETAESMATFIEEQGDWRTMTTPIIPSGYVIGPHLYSVPFVGDVTDKLQPGTKIKATRSVTPGTQVMKFDASLNQYAQRASGSITGPLAAAMATFTIEANLYLEAYPNSTAAVIERFDMLNNGWGMRIRPQGQLDVFYGSGGSFTVIDTHFAIPLREETHVAAILTVATKVVTLMVNGLEVASAQLDTVASAATSMTAAGNLTVGFDTAYLSGYLNDIRVWNVARTPLQVRDNMHQELVGNETGLAGYWKGNGNFNDSTAYANHLTASGGAIATHPYHSFKPVQYGVVLKSSHAAGVTTAIITTGRSDVLPRETLTNFAYSTVDRPAGFPINMDWKILGKTIVGKSISKPSVAVHAIMVGYRVYAYVPKDCQVKLEVEVPQYYSTSDGTRHDISFLEDDVRVVQTLYQRVWSVGNGGNTFKIEALVNPTEGWHWWDIRFYHANATLTMYALANTGTAWATNTALGFMTAKIEG